MTGWRWNPRIAAVCLVLFLIVQLTVPIVRITQEADRATRFGWQMFTRSAFVIDFTVTTASGQVEVALDDVLVVLRGELPLEELIPPHLCSTVEGARQVSWEGGELEC